MATKVKTAAGFDDSDEQTQGKLTQRFGIELPYTMTLRLRGVTPFLFNRMDIEAYEEEGPGKKRKPRTRPEYESMVWRDENGQLAYPVRSVIASIGRAGKYFKSPIASNGSATPTLFEALVPGDEDGTFGVGTWDAIDFRKTNHGDIMRTPKPTYRPRLEIGWLWVGRIGITVPELYGPAKLMEIITRAGAVMGMGDGRKIGFGRYVLNGTDLSEGLHW